MTEERKELSEAGQDRAAGAEEPALESKPGLEAKPAQTEAPLKEEAGDKPIEGAVTPEAASSEPLPDEKSEPDAQIARAPTPTSPLRIAQQALQPNDSEPARGSEENDAVQTAVSGAQEPPKPVVAGSDGIPSISEPSSAALQAKKIDASSSEAVGMRPLGEQAQALQAEMLRRRQEATFAQERRDAERYASELAAQRAAVQAHQAAQLAAQQAVERVAPPRRAASARASQSFKQQAEYFDESPPDSPIDDPPTKRPAAKPKPTPKQPSSIKSSAQAWEDPPQKKLALKLGDVNKALTNKWLQLYWPDDGKWWPCQVVSVDTRKKAIDLLYETGEEESGLELVELIGKGEVAWMHEKDMPKEKEVGPPAARKPSRGGPMWRSDSFDDEEDEPPASTSRGQMGNRRRQEEDDDEEEEAWAPGRKRKAALKTNAKYREDESEEESDYSESPPPSDQSSDWHSSEDDDKPRKKPKKKKKKPTSRPQPHISHQQPAQPRQSHMPHQMPGAGGSVFGRGGIFDEGPPFGSSFGSGGGIDPGRLPSGPSQPAISRDSMQGGFPIERGWGVMTGAANNPAAGYRGGWPGQPQDLNQLFQGRQQMNNGNMGHLHIPQVSMQGPGGIDLSRLAANPAMMGGSAPNISQGQWRAPGISTELMGAADWASQLGSQAMFRLPQMAQQQLVAQQQHLQAQRLQQQQQQNQHTQPEPQVSRPTVNLGSTSKSMEGILSQGLAASGKQVEVQQANGQWAKGTIMACLSRGSTGGSVMVGYDDGRQAQLLAAEEGRTFNIRMA